MSFELSWWLLTAIIGAASPLWVRAIVARWERPATLRTQRVARQMQEDNENSSNTELSEYTERTATDTNHNDDCKSVTQTKDLSGPQFEQQNNDQSEV